MSEAIEVTIDQSAADAVKHRGELFALLDGIDAMEMPAIKDTLYHLCVDAKKHADDLQQLQRQLKQKAEAFKEYN